MPTITKTNVITYTNISLSAKTYAGSSTNWNDRIIITKTDRDTEHTKIRSINPDAKMCFNVIKRCPYVAFDLYNTDKMEHEVYVYSESG